jgi:hypothetical protein
MVDAIDDGDGTPDAAIGGSKGDDSHDGKPVEATDLHERGEHLGDKSDKAAEKATEKPKEDLSKSTIKNVNNRQVSETQKLDLESGRTKPTVDQTSRGVAAHADQKSALSDTGRQQTTVNTLSSRLLSTKTAEDKPADQALKDCETVSKFIKAHPKGEPTNNQKADLIKALGGDSKSELKIEEEKLGRKTDGTTVGYMVTLKKGDISKVIAVPADDNNPQVGLHITTRGSEKIVVEVYKDQSYYSEFTRDRYFTNTTTIKLGTPNLADKQRADRRTPTPSPGPTPAEKQTRKEYSKEPAHPKTPQPAPEKQRGPYFESGARDQKSGLSPLKKETEPMRLHSNTRVGYSVSSSRTFLPKYPPGASVQETLRVAQAVNFVSISPVIKYYLFYRIVRGGAPMDLKQKGKAYFPNPFEAAGNFNFGLFGRALGIPTEVLLRGAGAYQWFGPASDPSFGNPLGDYPYGDEPKDQEWIKRGIDYFDELQRSENSEDTLMNPFGVKQIHK